MKTSVEVNGQVFEVYCQNIRGQLWINLNGRSFPVQDGNERKSKKKKGLAEHAGDLMAPMPGKVTKIFKQAGDVVAKGEPVVVMEAMKMEYTLKSDGNGTIEKINCAVGEQVVLGKILVHIKADKVS